LQFGIDVVERNTVIVLVDGIQSPGLLQQSSLFGQQGIIARLGHIIGFPGRQVRPWRYQWHFFLVPILYKPPAHNGGIFLYL